MNRFISIDTLRGLIMIVMALDHTIGTVSFQHPIEIALYFHDPLPDGGNLKDFPGYHNPVEQWSRLVTHICAPGFQLLAGMGLAISVIRARQRGIGEWQISRDLAIRGLVLILIEWLLMCTFVYKSPFLFLVLCCIGSSTLCFLVLRFLPKPAIGLVGIAIIALAPLYAPPEVKDASLATYFLDVWRDIALGNGGWFNVMYPILPWLGCFALGWWIGLQLHERQDESSARRQSARLVAAGIGLFLLGVALRWHGCTYAERIPLNGATPLDSWFWQFAKYPPSLVFLLLSLGVLLAGLGLLRPLDLREAIPASARFVSIYGRTALFYFVVHFYILGILTLVLKLLPTADQPPYSFGVAYLVWAGLVLLLWPVCQGYDRLRQRHRSVLRYF